MQTQPEKKSPEFGVRQLLGATQTYELDGLVLQHVLFASGHDTELKPVQMMVGATQAPFPSQYSATSVPICGPLGPVMKPQTGLPVLFAHVPPGQVPVLHGPVHGPPQHTPTTQKLPEMQSLPVPHAAPFARLKLAVTLVFPVTLTLQGELPVGVQPDQPVKTPVLEAVAESETAVP
jgi:hypothetical protein